MNDARIDTAMLLAAGLGTRMRPLTQRRPKPLIEVNGMPLIDHALQRLRAHGARRVVINVHWLAEQLVDWARTRRPPPEILVSDERARLLETGGGVRHALPLLGTEAPFFVANTDSIWLDGAVPALKRLETAWDERRMDALLLLCSLNDAVGHETALGDFVMDEEGRLRRAQGGERREAPVFTGLYVLHPRLFRMAPPKPAFSMNLLFDAAMRKGRLIGLMHDGRWLHVGTPMALTLAEHALRGAS